MLLFVAMVFGPNHADASFSGSPSKLAPVIATELSAQLTANEPFKLEIATGFFCGNDPVNRHDPLGLASIWMGSGGESYTTAEMLEREDALERKAWRESYQNPDAWKIAYLPFALAAVPLASGAIFEGGAAGGLMFSGQRLAAWWLSGGEAATAMWGTRAALALGGSVTAYDVSQGASPFEALGDGMGAFATVTSFTGIGSPNLRLPRFGGANAQPVWEVLPPQSPMVATVRRAPITIDMLTDGQPALPAPAPTLQLMGSPRAPTAFGTPYRQLSSKLYRALQQKVTERTITRAEWDRLQWFERLTDRRQAGIDAFWAAERQQLTQGLPGTRNWSPDAVSAILAGGQPRGIFSHHMFSVSLYPQMANDGAIIRPTTFHEHFYRWHGGSWRNPTHGIPLRPDLPEGF